MSYAAAGQLQQRAAPAGGGIFQLHWFRLATERSEPSARYSAYAGWHAEAERRRLIWMVLREVFVMTAVGLAIGLPVARATTKFIKSFLFEMKPNDPLAIMGAAVVLVLAAVAAGYGPAWRASRIDPWNALRNE